MDSSSDWEYVMLDTLKFKNKSGSDEDNYHEDQENPDNINPEE